MTEPILIQHQRAVLRELARLVEERTAAEAAAEATFKSRNEATVKEYQEAKQRVRARFEAEKAAAEEEYQKTKQESLSRFEIEHRTAGEEYAEARATLTRRFKQESERADKEYQETTWTVRTVGEAKKREAEEPRQEVEQKAAGAMIRIQEIRTEAKMTVKGWRQAGKYVGQVPKGRRGQEPLKDLKKKMADAEEELAGLKAMTLPRFFRVPRLLVLLLVLWAMMAVPLLILYPEGVGPNKLPWWGIATAGALLLELAVVAVLYGVARVRILHIWHPLTEALADAEASAEYARELAQKRYETHMVQLAAEDRQRALELGKVQQNYKQLVETIHHRRDSGQRQADEKYPRLMTSLEQRRDTEQREADEKYRRTLAGVKQRAESDARQVEQRNRQQLEGAKQQRETAWQAIVTKWQQVLAQAQTRAATIVRESRRLYPDWSDSSWQQWTPPTALPPAVRFGHFEVNVAAPAESKPPDPKWKMDDPPRFSLPALMPFPARSSMLFRARDAGRAEAVQALQAIMLRFLTALPPGKVRFTIIDPVGLGENFAAFMHLADFDEQLITSRIWTESEHIHQRLGDIAAHMENVIQKYLRNQYASIEEYNAAAGEVAEPFRVLVVANFPVNFGVDAARRLVSIANSGASCGVYTLVTVDTKQQMPDGFSLADLEQSCNTLQWKDQRFQWKDADFGKFPLALEAPPDNAFFTRTLHLVGEKAKDANRVEVSFDFISPQPEKWWTGSTAGGIDVPLGRAGATKRQHMKLGHGTAQHVLIAGKTGSGKSTLLHALITNLSLYFSPQEVELYLVDFKKGVEFKTYANYELPHARVVAVESEREFGLSVLQRLDAELKKRGDKFRALGVHDLAGYRQAAKAPLPRILLIVDEFQEFFTEDDKIAQEAALLLDRLVRQGRAFGLHILLGSQTLGGAYTLARSTIDQMAVRIALQCSEADAHLILSKDNSAARLLSRPGEAIYNDQNGLLEGNDIFQVVWLADEKREQLLKGVRQMARQRRLVPPTPQIVFEGNAPADIDKNHLLNELLQAPEWPATAPRAAFAWLGEAIAIKDPTAAVFRRQTSSNLLLIGQHDEGALGVLATGLVSLAAQHTPSREATAAAARFYVLDGSPTDAPHVGYLGRVAEGLPHLVRSGSWREVPVFLTEVAEEVDRRQKTIDVEYPSIYLLIYGLQRFRDLRKGDDDFGFSRRDDGPANPAAQLATLVRDGPGVGVHVLVWCDSLNNLNRSLERQALREFEMRVLFQMSVADSSTLIDTPAASKLGMHRALFHSEDQAVPEKFRPYGLPATAWLEDVKQRLAARKVADRASAGV